MRKNIKLFAIMCVFLLLVATVGEIPMRAKEGEKEEKTIRVVTQKQLNKALKDPEVDTIILRTCTYDFINISSKKASKKNIIIDAPNTYVFNYTKFKSINIESTRGFLENASGNTITVSDEAVIIVMKGAIVKKVIFKVVNPQYFVVNGGLIKKIAFEHNGHQSVYNSFSDRLIYLDTEFFYGYEDEEVEVVSCTFKLDDSGRILEEEYKYDYSPDDYSFGDYAFVNFIYNENGNIFKEVNFEYMSNEPSITFVDHEVDELGNELSIKYSNGDLYKFEYREELPYQESKKHFENGTYTSDTECFYDEKNRLVKEITTYYNIVDGVKSEEKKDEFLYEYFSNGCPKSFDYYYEDGSNVKETYKYDKSWNLTYLKDEIYHSETGLTSVYENKYEYDEYGNLLKTLYEYPDDDE